MAQEYKTPEWKKWSCIYCSRCFKSLGNYKGWYSIPLELYCEKCMREIQKREQHKLTEVES